MRRNKSSKKRVRNILIALIILGISVIIFMFCFYKYNLTSVSNDNTAKNVEITGTATQIGKILKDNNLIRNELIFKIYIKLNKINNMKASTYSLNETMTLPQIVEILTKGNSYNPDSIRITFKEGKNIRYIANVIAENTNNSYDSVIEKVNDEKYIDTLINKYWFLTNDIKNSKIYYDLEGYLFPDTYNFANKDVSVEKILETMLDETDKKLTPYKDKIEISKLTIHELFTLASIVELEGAKADDRASVAGVFYNRINSKWSLGSDVTTYYALKIDDFHVSLTEELGLYKCDNAYNTRCTSFIGLPVGPICNPGMESLLATINPKEHNYYYFVADCNGKVYLNSNSTGHFNTINKLKNEGNWCA